MAPAVMTGRLVESEIQNLGVDLRATAGYEGGEEAATGVGVSALVIAGANDRMVPLDSVRKLAALMSDAKLVVLADSGHMMPTDSPN